MPIKWMPDQVHEFGLLHDRFEYEDGKYWRVREQTNRDAILRANETLRRTAQKRTDGMRWALSIPQDDYDGLLARNPDLGSRDRQIKRHAWQRFMLSAESLPYRVYDGKRGMSA